MGKVVAILDTETTALFDEAHPERIPGMVSLATLLCAEEPELPPLYPVQIWYCHPRPGAWVTTDGLKVSGYDPDLWNQRGATSEADLMRKAQCLLAGASAYMCQPYCFNAAFDQRIVAAAQVATGVELPLYSRWTCPVGAFVMWRLLTGNLGRCNLDAFGEVSGYFDNNTRSEVHCAAEDVLILHHGLRWLFNQFKGGQQ